MNCYEGIITGRTTSIQSKTAEFIVSLNGINSRVSEVESGVSINEGQIRELSSKYSSLEQDATQFKTTVSQTYAKKDDFNEIATSDYPITLLYDRKCIQAILALKNKS